MSNDPRYQWPRALPRDRRRAQWMTLGITGLLLLGLLVFGFVTPLPLPGEEGVTVAFGEETLGLDGASVRSEARSQPVRARPEPPSPPPEHLTQDYEDAPAIKAPEPRRTSPAKPDPAPRKRPTEQPVPPRPSPPEPAPEPQPKVDEAALFPGQKNAAGRGVGQGGERGDQGRPDGAPEGIPRGEGMGTGAGGRGQGPGGGGIGYDLGGRHAMSLPSPSYPKQRSGKVVVTVWVDRAGRVVRAKAGAQGSTTFDPDLMRAAETAALKASFDREENAPAQQVGTITYIFKLRQ